MLKVIWDTVKENGIFGTSNSLWGKFCCRFTNTSNLLLTKNQSVKILHRQTKIYNRLYKKYKPLIENNTPSEISKNPCNKIWICWFQGEDNAPELIKACINSARKTMPNREVVILTLENLAEYTDFPNYIIEKYQKGIIPPTHFSDLIRIEVLCKHGGLWIDSTVLCTKGSNQRDVILNSDLFLYKIFDLDLCNDRPVVASSWLINAKANHPILTLTRALLFEYWKKKKYLDHYFVFHFFLAMASRKYGDLWNQMPSFNNSSPHTMFFELNSEFNAVRFAQLEKISDFHKLNRHIDYANHKKTIYNHIIETYTEK